MSDLAESVFEFLKSKPNAKALDIARALGVNRKDVNRFLYANHGTKLIRDENYRWSIIGEEGAFAFANPSAKSFGNGKFRGSSFFRVVSEGNEISVVFNSSHPILKALEDGVIADQKQLLDIVVGSFADALVDLYDLDQDLEDVIDFWGRYLASAVKEKVGKTA